MSQINPCTPIDCMGSYTEENPVDKIKECPFVSSLEDEKAKILATILVYPSLVKFRETILNRTPIGRIFVGYYNKFSEEAKGIMKEDKQLVTDILWLTVYVSPYLRAMFGEKTSKSSEGITPTMLLASEFRPGTYNALLTVLNKFKEGGSETFIEALNDAEKTLATFVGLSPKQALKKLKADPSRINN